MVPRLAVTTALIFAAAVLSAQGVKTVKIEFEAEGSREVWIQEKGQESRVPEKTLVSGKAVQLDVPTNIANKLVFAHDVKSGDVSSKPLDVVVRAGVWSVKAADVTHVYALRFIVKSGDDPVSAAVVRLTAGDEVLEEIVNPKDMGIAVFHVVPLGDVTVTVSYDDGGQQATLEAQTFEAKKGMADAEPFPLTVTGEVETVLPPAEETSGEKEQKEEAKGGDEKKEDAPSNPVATLINMLIGLIVIGGISYAIWRYVRANPDKTADMLGKAGVAMPGDPGGSPVSSPKKTGPPAQILLTDAAPTPADSPVASAVPAVKNPRLVKGDGSIYILQEGEQTVGREGASLTLTGESSVSRSHARLVMSGDAVTIEDSGSTNGTFVNGQRVSAPMQLSNGDAIQFGAVQVRYEE